MIERGVDASMLVTKGKPSISPTLKFGMLCVGIGLGILIGIPLGETLNDYYGTPKPIAPLAMVFLVGGFSLIINFVIERKMEKK
ncbi:hypothetical protein GCM10027275_39100 [Rhabdobacter roseus]